MTTRLKISGALIFVGLVSCGSDPVTSIELSVSYEESWGLEQFDIDIEGVQTSVEASPTVELWVPDSLDGEELSIAVSGMRTSDGKLERYAFGKTTATPSVGAAVKAQVALARLPCGAWCSEGESSCSGDSVVTCADIDDDSCLEWAEPEPCTGGDSCSLGACRSECINECATGELRCAGPGGVQECGNFDSDDCLEWSEAAPCADGESCSAGTCSDVCRDECTDGESSCSGGGVITCADRNLDGCTEWGPVQSCGEGQSCSAAEGQATCIDGCVDECSVNSCDGNTLRECGQFDADECLDRSPGTSCVPQDACLEGMCDPTAGCMAAAKVCAEPPASECINETTLRTYEEVGLCGQGVCEYSHTDTECEAGCDAGACNGFVPCTYQDWSFETISTNLDNRTYRSSAWLTVDQAGKVHVAYSEGPHPNHGVYASKPAGGTWSSSPMPTEYVPGWIAADSQGNVHLLYSVYNSYDDLEIKHAIKPSGSDWSSTTIKREFADNFALRVGKDDALHAIYDTIEFDEDGIAQGGTGQFWYAKKTTGSWQHESIGSPVSNFALDVDEQGQPHVAYFDYSSIANTDVVMYARRSNVGGWTSGQVATRGLNISEPTISVDPNGKAHIAYGDQQTRRELVVQSQQGAAWTKSEAHVDGGLLAYRRSSLNSDSYGRLHVLMALVEDDSLRLATREVGGSFSSNIIALDSASTSVSSLVVDSNDGMHIVFRQNTNNLRYGYRACK